jgi:hypothetical protein
MEGMKREPSRGRRDKRASLPYESKPPTAQIICDRVRQACVGYLDSAAARDVIDSSPGVKAEVNQYAGNTFLRDLTVGGSSCLIAMFRRDTGTPSAETNAANFVGARHCAQATGRARLAPR